MFPKWCGRGSMARRMLMEALLKSVGFTYILNLDSSLRNAWEAGHNPEHQIQRGTYDGLRGSPVWHDSFKSSYEIGHYHIDALQISAEQRRRVENDGSQNWSADKIRYLETLNQDHVEPADSNENSCNSSLPNYRDIWQRTSATWTGRRTECLLRFSCYRRCGRASRRPPLVLPRSSPGTRWCQTKGLAPWSRSTSESPSSSGPTPAECLWLQEGGGHRMREPWIALWSFVCMHLHRTDRLQCAQ